MRTCDVEGCDKKHYGNGLCNMHHLRLKRTGTVKDSKTPGLKERFESKYLPVPETGCWLWEGTYLDKGYGCFSINNKSKRAHRVSWELYRGGIPKGLHVLHHCDTPECVNPNHLFLGTNQDNVNDATKKRRHKHI